MSTTEPAALDREQLITRLSRMLDGLGGFPAGLSCPWPVARIFNELLKQSRMQAPDDPILKGIRFFEQSTNDMDLGASNALIGTVALLVQQVVVALEATPAAGARPKPRTTRPARPRAQA